VHFKGAGSVQYGAEPTAAIGQVLASDPSREATGDTESGTEIKRTEQSPTEEGGRILSATNLAFKVRCESFEKALDRFSETIRA
jgi:hypothetical protein